MRQGADSTSLREELLVVQERVLGADDPGTIVTVQGLAVVLQSTGEAERALPLIEQALAFRRLELGVDHPTR